MSNLLFISIAFPPKNDPECLQTARYFKYLVQRSKFKIDVVTSQQPTLFMPEDSSLNSYSSGYRQLIQIPIWEAKLTNFLLNKTGLGWLMSPDSKMSFHWQWQKVVRQLKYKPNIIYSRSNPISSAFMAMKLKKAYDVPWVMHMSDPWTLSPLRHHISGQDKKDETSLLACADMVTFTTSKTKALYARAYPQFSSRFRVLPNVFDPDDIVSPGKSQRQYANFRIVYTGGLTRDRSLLFIIKVLERIKAVDEMLLSRLEIIFAGPMDRHGRRFFKDHKHLCLKHLGELSYMNARQLQQDADVLMVVDSPTPSEAAVFFPSKLLDYFLTAKPILAITPEQSTTREILADYPSTCFVHDDWQGIADFIIDGIKTRFADHAISSIPPNKFSAKSNADLLNELLCDLSERNSMLNSPRSS